MISSHKVFCVGMNKTGTSTMKGCFQALGFVPVASPAECEPAFFQRIVEHQDYGPAVEHAKKFVGFEDRPWNVWEMYRHLSRAYPGAKFILTLRERES